MLQAGLGQSNPDVPLSDLSSKPDQSVLLKPNWVYHRNQGPWGNASLVTHPEFLLQTLLEVTAAKPRKVTLGDAPIQGCDWTSLVSSQFRSQVHDKTSEQSGVEIQLVDFRRTVTKTDDLGDGVDIEQRKLESVCVLFDLGTDSCLEPISILAVAFVLPAMIHASWPRDISLAGISTCCAKRRLKQTSSSSCRNSRRTAKQASRRQSRILLVSTATKIICPIIVLAVRSRAATVIRVAACACELRSGCLTWPIRTSAVGCIDR